MIKADTQVLRSLAAEYMELASLPIHKEQRELWFALNRCTPQRPLALIDQIPWHEMDVDGSLVNKVEDPYWYWIETYLRRQIYQWKHMPADMVLNPYILLPRPIALSGYGIDINEDAVALDPHNSVVGHKYHNQFTCLEDAEKIKMQQVLWDEGREKEIIQEAEYLFEGVAPFKLTGLTLHLGFWDTITTWMGVDHIYTELYDTPELLHAIMEKLTQSALGVISQLNEKGLFDAYTNLCHCSHTFSDDLPSKGCDPDNPKSKDVWAFGLAQLFTSVSPKITDEFEVPYMQRLFPHFGAIYYGCCDRLDDRLDVITKMPKIRKISCSPWSDREAFAEKLPKGYVMSNKPMPAVVAGASVDWNEVRQDIRRTVNAARAYDVPLELILKDISTVNYEPQRLWEWSRIAREELTR